MTCDVAGCEHADSRCPQVRQRELELMREDQAWRARLGARLQARAGWRGSRPQPFGTISDTSFWPGHQRVSAEERAVIERGHQVSQAVAARQGWLRPGSSQPAARPEASHRRSTPAERAAELAQFAAEDRAREDRVHLPGGDGGNILQRCAHWDSRVDQLESWFMRADQAWRDLRSGYGQWPEPEEQAQIDAALAKRDALAAECSEARRNLKACLAEWDAVCRG